MKKNGHLRLDPRNARKHSDRNKKLIRQSLTEVGAGRGVLADANGIIRAGNGIFEAAQEQGLKIKVVETDGKTLLVTKRKDLKGKQAVRAAMLDNLASDSSAYDYDAEILKQISGDDELLKQLMNEQSQIAALLAPVPEFVAVGIDEQGRLDEKAKVKCPECGHEFEPGQNRIKT